MNPNLSSAGTNGTKKTSLPLNPRLIAAEYAVRGALALRAEELKAELRTNPGSLPFDSVVNCNIGNPQQLGQKPLTFLSQVLCLVEAPMELFEKIKTQFPEDVVERALEIKQAIPAMGAYSHSKGYDFIRKQVSTFIQARDQTSMTVDHERIFLSNGASEAISRVLHCMANDEGRLGVLIPIPQYPLYHAELTLLGYLPVPYFMDETNDGWQLSKSQLEKAFEDAIQKGINPIAIVLINPGNPTGNTLSSSQLHSVIQFGHEKGIAVLADEVYQDNVYPDASQFTSCRKAAIQLEIYDKMNLFSFHSVSKGLMGECGRRGGYVECSPGISQAFIEQLYKLSSLSLSPNTQGQLCVSVMVNPPKPGQPSYSLWMEERTAIYESLMRRASKLANSFNALEGVSCAPALGALYLFPRINFPKRFISKAEEDDIAPDAVYAMELLNATGVCMVPGSGFGQVSGTFHVRSTFLPNESDFDAFIARISAFHSEFMRRYK